MSPKAGLSSGEDSAASTNRRSINGATGALARVFIAFLQT
jgi:hypothetical protein